jgi:hypothetical protein
MIRSMVNMITELSSKCTVPLYRVCQAVGVARSSVHRWHTRIKRNTLLVQHPGPRKVETADITEVSRDVASLVHGGHRSAGVSALYAKYRWSVPRRKFNDLVSMARAESNRQHRSELRRITWIGVGVVWAVDDSECNECDRNGCKVNLHNMKDLGSRYMFPPIGGEPPCGEEVAANLWWLCKHYGSCLFLKRDNHSILNHPSVDDIMAENVILPLNSPVNYPPYNGSIEKAQSEMKTELARQLAPALHWQASEIEPYARAAANQLNHQARDVLNGQNACQVFFNKRVTFSKNERKKTYDWIKSRQDHILNVKGALVSPQTAWRVAAEQWLVQNGFIRITFNKPVLPIL